MTCERHKGLRLKNPFVYLGEGCNLMWASSWRGVNCGDTVNPVLAKNREWQPAVVTQSVAAIRETVQMDSSKAVALSAVEKCLSASFNGRCSLLMGL